MWLPTLVESECLSHYALPNRASGPIVVFSHTGFLQSHLSDRASQSLGRIHPRRLLTVSTHNRFFTVYGSYKWLCSYIKFGNKASDLGNHRLLELLVKAVPPLLISFERHVQWNILLTLVNSCPVPKQSRTISRKFGFAINRTLTSNTP